MKTQNEIEFLAEQAKIFGVASVTLKDGNAFIFDKAYLRSLLDKNPDVNYINILVENKKDNGN